MEKQYLSTSVIYLGSFTKDVTPGGPFQRHLSVQYLRHHPSDSEYDCTPLNFVLLLFNHTVFTLTRV